MKLHKTRCPRWERIQLHLEESSGCLEFQGRAGHVLLGCPILGPRLEVGRFWLTAAGTPYTGAASRGREVLANRSPTGFTWGQNTAQSTYGLTSQGQAPLPKQSSSGIRPLAPNPKEAGSWNSTTQPHSLRGRVSFPAQVDRANLWS